MTECLRVGGGALWADILQGCSWWEFGDEPLTLIKPGITIEEAMEGKVTWKCPIFKQDVPLGISKTNAMGYITAECMGVGCEHLRG